MARIPHLAFLAATSLVLATNSVRAGGPESYATVISEPETTSILTMTAAAPPLMETYAAPVPMVAVPTAPRDSYYDTARYGGNAEFGYQQSSACGGVLDGEHCLVILNDHMRRVRLERDAGTILVGNPLIADVTVLGKDMLFVSARSIGSTNIIVLDKQGNEIITYEVFVQEPRTKRVTLRQGFEVENYQCTPYCQRALAQSDSVGKHSQQAGLIQTDIGLDSTAVGLQSGTNPNSDPGALRQKPAPSTGAAPVALPGGAAAAPAGAGGGLAASAGGIAGPGLGLMQTLLGTAAPAAAPAPAAPQAPAQPARTDAPPLPN